MTFRGVDNRRVIPYARRVTSVGSDVKLEFSKGAFTNASPRYILVNGRMTGPFAGGVLATRVIGGKRVSQFESAKSTINTYSDVFREAISDWANVRSNVTDDATASPLDSITADKVYDDDSLAASHYVRQILSFVSGNPYFFTAFVKKAEYSDVRLYLHADAFGSTVTCDFDLENGVAYDDSNCAYYGILPMPNDWYHIYICAVATVTTDASVLTLLLNDHGVSAYDGDGSSGVYAWGANIPQAEHLTSYIQVTTPAATRAKDQFKWAEANVPSWTRSGFKARLIMHQGTDEMLAAGTQEPTLFAFDTTAKGEVKAYFDHADKKLKWLDNTGALGESAALDWSLDSVIDIEWNPDNGSNSTLKVDGGGVDTTTYTGTQTAVADGDLYYGMDTSEANQANIFLISEPEPL